MSRNCRNLWLDVHVVEQVRTINDKLFNFFMQRYFTQERIVLFPLNTGRCVLPVFGGDIPGHAGNTAVFLLGAFQNNLDSIGAFLCHRLSSFSR
jgi:hypothetical protein